MVSFTVQVTDSSGLSDRESFRIAVENVAPQVSIGGDSSVTAGELYTLSLSVSDPGADTISGWVIDWGDGVVETRVGSPSTADHVYLKPKALAGDFDGDGDVDGSDLVMFSDNMGKTGVGLAGDFDGDDNVDADDMDLFIANFGKIGYDVYTITANASDEDGTYSAGSRQVDVQAAPASSSMSQPGGPQVTTAPAGSDPAGESVPPATTPAAEKSGTAAPNESAGKNRPADNRSGSWLNPSRHRSSIWDQPFGSQPETRYRHADSETRSSREDQIDARRPYGAMVDLSGRFHDFRLSSKLFNDRPARPWIGRFVNDLAFTEDMKNPNHGIQVTLSEDEDHRLPNQRKDDDESKVHFSTSAGIGHRKRV